MNSTDYCKSARRWFYAHRLAWLLIAVAVLRIVMVRRSDLPTGDEINAYILNADRLVRSGAVPPLSEHPGVSLIYAALIAVIDKVAVTLSGVLASHCVTCVSGVLAVFFVYRSVEVLVRPDAALPVAAFFALFPGFYVYPFRGDLNLYALCLAALQWALAMLSVQPRWTYAGAAGLFAGAFCLARSDGAYVAVLTFAAFGICFPKAWRWLAVGAVVALLGVGLFQVGRYAVMRDWGAGASHRALEAFYQAEGLHDRQGGTWHDYSARGLARFGASEQYGNSVLRVVLAYPGVALDRCRVNGKILGDLWRNATGTPWWGLGVLVVAGVCRSRNYRRLIFLLALPSLLTCGIYLVFYLQRSYFVLFSYSLSLAAGAGVYLALAHVYERVGAGRHWPATGVHVIAVALALLCTVSLPRLLDSRYETSCARYWGALVCVKEQAVRQPGRFLFAADYGGARAMYSYTSVPDPGLDAERVRGLPDARAVAAYLSDARIGMVLAPREQTWLWNLAPTCATVVFANAADDVRVLNLLPRPPGAGQP